MLCSVNSICLSSWKTNLKIWNSVRSPYILLFRSFYAHIKYSGGLGFVMRDRQFQGNSTLKSSFLSWVRKSRLTETPSPQACAPAGTVSCARFRAVLSSPRGLLLPPVWNTLLAHAGGPASSGGGRGAAETRWGGGSPGQGKKLLPSAGLSGFSSYERPRSPQLF